MSLVCGWPSLPPERKRIKRRAGQSGGDGGSPRKPPGSAPQPRPAPGPAQRLQGPRVPGGVRLSFMPSVQKEIETVRHGGQAGHVRESRHEEAVGGLVYVFMYL